jgi:hypothetical protein
VLLVEAIVEASNEPQFAKTLDIAMLVLSDGGKERTRAEWQQPVECRRVSIVAHRSHRFIRIRD